MHTNTHNGTLGDGAAIHIDAITFHPMSSHTFLIIVSNLFIKVTRNLFHAYHTCVEARVLESQALRPAVCRSEGVFLSKNWKIVKVQCVHRTHIDKNVCENKFDAFVCRESMCMLFIEFMERCLLLETIFPSLSLIQIHVVSNLRKHSILGIGIPVGRCV